MPVARLAAVDPSRRRFAWAGTGTGGWLLLAELDGLDENAVVRTYTWGLDLAGLNGSIGSVTGGADLESAGGIGGLLAMHDPDSDGPGNPGDVDRDFAVLYDANGNVGQLVG